MERATVNANHSSRSRFAVIGLVLTELPNCQRHTFYVLTCADSGIQRLSCP